MYSGLAKLALSMGQNEKGAAIVKDQAQFDGAIGDLKKAVEKDANISNEFNEIGKKLFSQKLYAPAAAVFEVASGL